MNSPLLEATGLFKSDPAVKVLKNASLAVAHGDTFAIIGPNGAGKTTLFKVLSGELFPDSGRVVHEGRDVTTVPAWQRVRLGFGRSFQVARVFPDLTTQENVVISVEAHWRNAGLGQRLGGGFQRHALGTVGVAVAQVHTRLHTREQ